MFPQTLWNVNARTLADEPRTNNHLEGWHKRFKTVVDKHHPNIYDFMERLRGEQARTETLIEKLIGGVKLMEVRYKVIFTRSRYFPTNLYTTFISINPRVHILKNYYSMSNFSFQVRKTNEKLMRIVEDFNNKLPMEYPRGIAYNIK